MRKQFLGRFLPFIMALSLISPCLIVSPYAVDTSISAVLAARDVAEKSGQFANDVLDSFASWFHFNFNIIHSQPVSAEQLEYEINRYNNSSWITQCLSTSSGVPEAVGQFFQRLFTNKGKSLPSQILAHAKSDPLNNDVYRPYIPGYGWLVDSAGVFPYCSKEEYEAVYPPAGSSGTPAPVTPKPFDGRWLTTNSIRDSKKVTQKSFADMDATRADLANQYPNSTITLSSMKVGNLDCKVLRRLEEGAGNRDWVWCGANGLPYVYVEPSSQGAAQDWNYDKIQDITNNQTEEITNLVTEQGDKIDKLIEINNETGETKVNVPVQVGPNEWSLLTLNADNITIDRSEDNRTIYQIDSHDVTYNVENNYYEYNYYTYNFEYTYNNTYVTYIGSTAEYQPKEWALYYELPDGRSSADLTEEDVAGLSFQFQDIVNYERSATDTSICALYHFDGNTEDASYFSDQGSFAWNKGASISFMESNAFNGALYLDEQEHQFTIKLPSNIGSQDFTLQWRYYQNSATTTDHNENYVTVGGQKLLGWSERSLYSLGTTKLSTNLSVGSWQELALVRNGGTLYIYHNGISIGSASLAASLTNEIAFHLGSASRAHSMIDELRVLDFALYTRGKAYTPTSVPYDTNAVLVLPKAKEDFVVDVEGVPGTDDVIIHHKDLVDSYMQYTYNVEPILKFDATKNDHTLLTEVVTSGTESYPSGYRDSNWYPSNSSTNVKFWACNSTSGLTVDRAKGLAYFSSKPQYLYFDGRLFYQDTASVTPVIPITYYGGTNGSRGIYPPTGDFTFTLVFDDYSVASASFSNPNVSSSFSKTYTLSSGSRSIQLLATQKYYNKTNCFLELCLYGSTPIRYFELVRGTEPNPHQYVNVYNEWDEIIPGTPGKPPEHYEWTEYYLEPNTAAVQTNIPIHGYTVGGVRPTFPERGDVWMPVEGSRISGVYVYNGQAWEETNARWWTGKRWIPIYAFDLVTLADMWDVGSSTGEDVTPSITSEYGFWNWWKNQWLDFRQWLAEHLGGGTGGSMIFPSPSDCEHTYSEKVMTPPTCTQKGTALYTCSKCGDSYTETLDAAGHDWIMEDSIPDETDEAGEVMTSGYDLYRCSVCGEEYKDFTRTGPPGAEGGSTLSELIQELFTALGDLAGNLIGWVLDLGKDAMAGFGSLGEYFKEKAEEIQGFGGEYVGFLGVFFEVIPPEIKTCITLALICGGLLLFIRKVIL